MTHKKIWYWAAEDATPFRHYTLQDPQVYADRNIKSTDWEYPGELPGFTTWNGNLPVVPPGRAGCHVGKLEWFAEGAPPGTIRPAVPEPDPNRCRCPALMKLTVQAVLPFDWLPFLPNTGVFWPAPNQVLVVLYAWRPGDSAGPPIVPAESEPLFDYIAYPEFPIHIAGFRLEGPAPGPIAHINGNGTFGVACAFWFDKTRNGPARIRHNYTVADGVDEITLPGMTAWPTAGEVIMLTARTYSGGANPPLTDYVGPFRLGFSPSPNWYTGTERLGPSLPNRRIRHIPIGPPDQRIAAIRLVVDHVALP